MSNKKDYKDFIITYLEGTASEKETAELFDWMDENPENKKHFFCIKDIWDTRLTAKAQIGVKPFRRTTPVSAGKERQLPNWRRIAINTCKYAAIVALTVWMTKLMQKEPITEVQQKTAYHKVLVQNGKQSQLIELSDGTMVWINASSSLKYPETFNTKERNVWLDGEAYFEVTENRERPFVVHTGMLDVKVLGTSFNVTAYRQDEKVTTTLVKGIVELWTGSGGTRYATTLEPNQQAVYMKTENKIKLHTVDPSLYTAWKDGYYKFYNTSFGEIAERLEKMYAVRISFSDESLRQIPYSGTFVQVQSLTEVLEIMRGVKPFRYTVKDNQVTILK